MQDIQTILPVGAKVGDRYIVESLLGRGGFGAVYLVRDQRVKGNLFALKEIVDSNKQERARFAFEGEVLKRLDHPTLPRVYRVFQDDVHNRAYMLMDYIEGPNLETLRQKQPNKHFSPARVMTIMTPIMNAVSYLHSQTPPIIHRDIKPSNIIVPAAEDQAVLVDFGIAKEFDPDSTTTAIRRCSPGYGAPEQYSRGTNIRTDIYGLAATFYTLLTGIIPEDAFYRMTQLGSQHADPLEPIDHLVKGIPPHVSAAIFRAMSLNSADRFQSVEQFKQALNAYPLQHAAAVASPTPIPLANHNPVTPVPEAALLASPPQTTVRRTRRRPKALLLVLLLLLALGLGVVAAFWPQLTGEHISPALTPTPIVHHQTTPQPTATVKPTAQPSPRATLPPAATTVPPTSTPVPVVTYPNVTGTHTGFALNTNSYQKANMSVYLTQNGANLGGSVTISLPLQGSGPLLSGFVQTNNYIQFVVKGYNGNAPLFFSGTVQSDGSMSGQYCSLDSSGHCNPNSGGQGTWSVGAAPSGSGSSFIITDSPIAYRQ